MSDSPLISLQHASVAVGGQLVLRDLSWDISAGGHWVITGSCGVGKTVLAEFLVNKHRLAAGVRQYNLYPGLPVSEQLEKGLGFISFSDTSDLFVNLRNVHYYQQRYQAFDSDGHLTVREYFELSEANLADYHVFLDQMGLTPLLDTERIKLSSGQTRKILLAKVLMSSPKVLILDNAYIGLDTRMRQVLNETLDRWVAQKDITLILSGHHRELPNCITKRLHIDSNREVQQGPLSLPYSFPKPVIKEALTDKIKAHFQGDQPQNSIQEIIRMEQVSVQYGSNLILDKITWRVTTGEKWAVYGPNGSGKSTLLSLIYADNPQAYSKEIFLFGKKRGSGESIWDIKARIGFTSPELHAYFKENPTAQQLVLTGLTDTFFLKRSPTEAEQELSDLLFAYFDLEEIKMMRFKQLSTGTQRLLLFIRALIKAPPVLLLDEPFQGMDEGLVEKCRHLLDEVLTEQHTLLFISHYKEEWPTCVDQVLDLGG